MKNIWNEGASLVIDSRDHSVLAQEQRLREAVLDNHPTWVDIHMQNLVECWKRNSTMFCKMLSNLRKS